MSIFEIPSAILDPLQAHVQARARAYPHWLARLSQPHPERVSVACWSERDVAQLVQTAMDCGCAFYGQVAVAIEAYLATSSAMLLDQVDRADFVLHLGHHWFITEIAQTRSGPRRHWPQTEHHPAQVRLDPSVVRALFLQVSETFPTAFALYGPLILTAGLVLSWEELAQANLVQAYHAYRLRGGPGPSRFAVQVLRQPEHRPMNLIL